MCEQPRKRKILFKSSFPEEKVQISTGAKNKYKFVCPWQYHPFPQGNTVQVCTSQWQTILCGKKKVVSECPAATAVWKIMEKPRNPFLSSSTKVGRSLLGRRGVDIMKEADKNIKGH